MDFGSRLHQVVSVNALWKGDMSRIPYFGEKVHEPKQELEILEQQRKLLQECKPYWQNAVEELDASLVSDELIRLVPILPCMMVEVYLKENSRFNRTRLKEQLALLQARRMILSMDMLVDLLNIRGDAPQHKMEEAIQIFLELKADMRWVRTDKTVLYKALFNLKNKHIAEVLLRNGARIPTEGESYYIMEGICREYSNPWFLEHKAQLVKAGLNVNATSWGLTLLENLLMKDSGEIEMALEMGVNPKLCDGKGRTIEQYYQTAVSSPLYNHAREKIDKNMQMIREHLLRKKEMHGIYLEHALICPKGPPSYIQSLPLDINELIVHQAFRNLYD